MIVQICTHRLPSAPTSRAKRSSRSPIHRNLSSLSPDPSFHRTWSPFNIPTFFTPLIAVKAIMIFASCRNNGVKNIVSCVKLINPGAERCWQGYATQQSVWLVKTNRNFEATDCGFQQLIGAAVKRQNTNASFKKKFFLPGWALW